MILLLSPKVSNALFLSSVLKIVLNWRTGGHWRALSCYWIWGLDKKNRLPEAAMSNPCQKRSSISPNPFTPSLLSGLLLLSLFYIRYFTFTSQLTITVSHTGLGLRQNSQCNHNCLAHRFLDRFIIYEQTSTYFFTTLLVFFMFALLPPLPLLNPPLLIWLLQPAASRWLSMSVRLHKILSWVQIAFLHSAATLLVACHVRVQTGLPTEQKCQGQRRDQSLSQLNTIRGPLHTPRPSHSHVGGSPLKLSPSLILTVKVHRTSQLQSKASRYQCSEHVAWMAILVEDWYSLF